MYIVLYNNRHNCFRKIKQVMLCRVRVISKSQATDEKQTILYIKSNTGTFYLQMEIYKVSICLFFPRDRDLIRQTTIGLAI